MDRTGSVRSRRLGRRAGGRPPPPRRRAAGTARAAGRCRPAPLGRIPPGGLQAVRQQDDHPLVAAAAAAAPAGRPGARPAMSVLPWPRRPTSSGRRPRPPGACRGLQHRHLVGEGRARWSAAASSAARTTPAAATAAMPPRAPASTPTGRRPGRPPGGEPVQLRVRGPRRPGPAPGPASPACGPGPGRPPAAVWHQPAGAAGAGGAHPAHLDEDPGGQPAGGRPQLRSVAVARSASSAAASSGARPSGRRRRPRRARPTSGLTSSKARAGAASPGRPVSGARPVGGAAAARGALVLPALSRRAVLFPDHPRPGRRRPRRAGLGGAATGQTSSRISSSTASGVRSTPSVTRIRPGQRGMGGVPGRLPAAGPAPRRAGRQQADRAAARGRWRPAPTSRSAGRGARGWPGRARTASGDLPGSAPVTHRDDRPARRPSGW